jgi:hypothetical protein
VPDIDLEPGGYRVKGRKEPILLPGWWIGLLIFLGIIPFSMFVLRPLYGAWSGFIDGVVASLF